MCQQEIGQDLVVQGGTGQVQLWQGEAGTVRKGLQHHGIRFILLNTIIINEFYGRMTHVNIIRPHLSMLVEYGMGGAGWQVAETIDILKNYCIFRL